MKLIALVIVSLASSSFLNTDVNVPDAIHADPIEVTVEEANLGFSEPTKTLEKRSPAVKVGYLIQVEKVFVCGPVYSNWVGGRNSDCFWK